MPGPWSADETSAFLERERVPVRIACNGRSGHPVLASLWYVPIGGSLWCATPRSAAIVSLLEDDPRCGFEVSLEQPPYQGVRGSATARCDDARGEEILKKLLDRYLGATNQRLQEELLAKAANETAIELVPDRVSTWDFRGRMEPVA